MKKQEFYGSERACDAPGDCLRGILQLLGIGQPPGGDDLGRIEAVTLQARVELAAGQAQEPGRFGLVVVRLGHRLLDQLTFDCIEAQALGWDRTRRDRAGRNLARGYGGGWRRVGWRASGGTSRSREGDRQVVAGDQPALAQDHRALDRVPELPDVPGPAMR